jgi:hypothetical protein
MTQYEKLRSLPDAQKYLKANITFANLEKITSDRSGLEFAKDLRKAKEMFFETIKNRVVFLGS